MTKRWLFGGGTVVLAVLLTLFACSSSGPSAEQGEAAEGPHGGRLIGTGARALELRIEEGSPPRFVAWGYADGKPLPAEQLRLTVTTLRLGGKSEIFAFEPQGERLVSTSGVGEPHSFVVNVEAAIDGQTLRERYDSFEGRVTISPRAAKDSGIVVAPAGPGEIIESLAVNGIVMARRGGESKITARFPGVVRRIDADVGDRVAKGATLALIESDASLANYALRSPLAGTVIAREARLGAAASGVLFEVADLETLWLQLRIFGSDATRVRVGAPVLLQRPGDGLERRSSIARVAPVLDPASQSMTAEAVLRNPDGAWRPGMAVRAAIETRRSLVPLRVPLSALQQIFGWEVVFVRVGDIFEARPLELGRRDAAHVEVLSGLAVGDQIVVEQSFLIKADIEKSGAVHDH